MPANVMDMAYVGSTPWHGLGTQVERGIDVDAMRVAAGLDWPVHRRPVTFEFNGKVHQSGDGVIFREVDGDVHVFDTVGPKYVPFQNAEVLDFFREYVEAGDMYIETAGALETGRTVWALAKMEEAFTLGRNDRVEGYVLISNPHRYGKGATVKFTSVRVVCANTLAMALGDGSSSIMLPHTRTFDESYRQDAKKRLGIAREKMHAFEEDARALAAVSMSEEDVMEVYEAVFPKQDKVQERVASLFLGAGRGADLETANMTAWGALNAVTEYYDWHAGRTQDARVRSAWYGSGASKKQQALVELLRRAGVDRKN